MSNKFINWIDRKGVPIMGFVLAILGAVLLATITYRLIFDTLPQWNRQQYTGWLKNTQNT